MNYEKKYKEALEMAKDFYKGYKQRDNQLYADDLESIFPELRESEDERIRKELLSFCQNRADNYPNDPKYANISNWISWLEKQGKQKGYTFKSIPRLLDMIEPSDKAKAYCQKLIDALAKEGYNTDAKIVEEVLKGWNGEDVPMAIMDEQKPVFEMKTPEESLGIDSDTYNKIVDECIYGEQNPTDKVVPKFKVKYAGSEYNVLEVKDIVGVTYYGIEDEPNHIDYVKAENCEIISGYAIKEDGSSYPTKPVVFSEQKPNNKVEPKFHEGEWITNGDYTWKIVEVKPLDYILQSQDGNIVDDTISHVDEQFHSFTIEDAKDGDVLADDDNNIFIFDGTVEEGKYPFAYCGLTAQGFDSYDIRLPFTHDNNIHPATWKQRNLLFKKMKEAGYEWDDEKKELNKIEQKSQRMVSAEAKEALYDKPTDEEMKELLRTEYEKGRADTIAEMKLSWSEEDEKMLEGIVNIVKDVRCQSLLSEIEIYDDYIDWLKSLKDRYTWRPSNEQIDTLEHFVRSIGESGYASPYDNNTKLLYSLLEQLKKLTE